MLTVGDSIVRFIDAKKITNHRNFETVSISGGKIENIPEQINKLASKCDIENIIFHIGTNHIPREIVRSVYHHFLHFWFRGHNFRNWLF